MSDRGDSPCGGSATPEKNPDAGPFGRRAAIMIAAVLILLYLVKYILLPFVIAGIIAYLAAPLINRLRTRTRLPRYLIASGVLVAVLAIVALIGILGLSAVVENLDRVAAEAEGGLSTLLEHLFGAQAVNLLGYRLDAQGIATDIHGWLSRPDRVLAIATGGVAAVFGFFLTWILLAYFLFDGPRIARGLLWLVPPRHRPLVHRVAARADPVLRRYFIGVAIVVVYTSCAAYVGLGLILGFRAPVFLALMTGFLEVIPVIGPITAAIVPGLIAVAHAAALWNVLSYALYIIALRLSVDQLVGPIVLGRSARLSPAVVIFCFLAGAVLFGVAGVILSVPTALIIKVALLTLYEEPPADGSGRKTGTG